MPVYTFSREKNFKLIEERNISFEEIIALIEDGRIIDILEHHNQKKYEGQKIYIISFKNYVYLVPFITDIEGNIFLKTIIPSRKAKKKYEKRGANEKK